MGQRVAPKSHKGVLCQTCQLSASFELLVLRELSVLSASCASFDPCAYWQTRVCVCKLVMRNDHDDDIMIMMTMLMLMLMMVVTMMSLTLP